MTVMGIVMTVGFSKSNDRCDLSFCLSVCLPACLSVCLSELIYRPIRVIVAYLCLMLGIIPKLDWHKHYLYEDYTL